MTFVSLVKLIELVITVDVLRLFKLLKLTAEHKGVFASIIPGKKEKKNNKTSHKYILILETYTENVKLVG